MPLLAAMATIVGIGVVALGRSHRRSTSALDWLASVVACGGSLIVRGAAKHEGLGLLSACWRGDQLSQADLALVVGLLVWSACLTVAARGMTRYRGRHRN